MRLSEAQKRILERINAPYMDKDDLNDLEIEELCDYITNYVIDNELKNDEISAYGEELLQIHDDIIQ